MSQHLNRLNDEEAAEFDKVFKQFCEAENRRNKMKVYLVEVVIREKLHPIAIKTNWELAHNLLAGRAGLITEMIIDKEYPERPWRQWAYGERHDKDET